jgi:hypothetical protein
MPASPSPFLEVINVLFPLRTVYLVVVGVSSFFVAPRSHKEKNPQWVIDAPYLLFQAPNFSPLPHLFFETLIIF